jgi:hypothetical protein
MFLIDKAITKYKHGLAKKYGFLWITLILFTGSLLGHWYLVLRKINPARKFEGYI